MQKVCLDFGKRSRGDPVVVRRGEVSSVDVEARVTDGGGAAVLDVCDVTFELWTPGIAPASIPCEVEGCVVRFSVPPAALSGVPSAAYVRAESECFVKTTGDLPVRVIGGFE